MGTFSYNVTTTNPTGDSKVGKCTITITGFELKTDVFKTNKSRWIGVKIDGKTLVGVTADPIPKVVYQPEPKNDTIISNVSSSVSGFLGAKAKSREIIYVKTKKERNELRTRLTHDILLNGINNFQNKLYDKIAKGKNKKTISVSGASRKIAIKFNIFGYSQTDTIDVGITSTVHSGDTALSEAEYLSIASVNNGIPYLINQEAYEEYGWIESVLDFNEVTDPNVLKQLSQLYINSMQFDNMEIQLNALDLHYLNKDIPGFKLLDKVRCISAPHGLDKDFPITTITIPLDSPDQVTYTLGNKPTNSSMSGSVSLDAKKFTKQLNVLPTKAYLLDTAKAEMSAKLNKRTTGYVNITELNDTSQAIIISSKPDWTDPEASIWKWDMNGLGFSDKSLSDLTQQEREAYENELSASGVNKKWYDNSDDRWYKVGITNDGTIVADVIKAGILSDAAGLNYWNLVDGTFSLQPSSIIVDKENDTSLSGVMINAETARYAQYGGVNYLRSTKKFDNTNTIPDGYNADTYDSYSNFGWILGRASDDGIYPRIFKALKTPTDTENVLGLAQQSIAYQQWIPLYADTTYTLSFYAKRDDETPQNSGRAIIETESDKCQISFINTNFESEVYENSGTKIHKYTGKINYCKTKWQRYSYTFSLTGYGSDDEVYKVRIKFGNSLTPNDGELVVVHYLYICSPQLERGNMASDWTQAISDIYHDINTTLETNKDDWEDEYWNQQSVYNVLTENSKKKGIFLKNKELYINADIINTGTIKDSKNNSVWNLSEGTLKTNGTISGGQVEVFNTTTFPSLMKKVKRKVKKKKGKVVKRTYYRGKESYSARPIISMDNGFIRFKWDAPRYSAIKIDCGTISCLNNDSANKYTMGINGYQGIEINSPNLLLNVKQLSVGSGYASGKDISIDIPYDYYTKGKLKKSVITLEFYKGLMVGYKIGNNKAVGADYRGIVFDDVAAGVSDGYVTVTDVN